MKGVIFDAGGLISVERGHRTVSALIQRCQELEIAILIPVGVLAQVWRGGFGRQTPLARLLRHDRVRVVSCTADDAMEVGMLCGQAGTSDVVDASVVLAAVRTLWPVVTSDPADIRALASGVTIISV